MSFDAGEESLFNGKQVTCEFQLKSDDEGGLSGFLIHEDYHKATEQSVPLSGFSDEDFISLVAIFPHRGVYLSSGEMTINHDQIDSEMNFYGNLDESRTKLTGTWEIVEDSFFISDRIHVNYRGGTFEVTLSE